MSAQDGNENRVSLSTGACYLKRGDRSDPEDYRMTHRLTIATGILSGLGIEPVWTHGSTAVNEWVDFGRVRHACTNTCKCSWPEWATDAMFQLAFDLADEVQTQRGGWYREQAEARKSLHG